MKKILALLILFAPCADAHTTKLSMAEGDFSSISSMLKMFKVNAGRYPSEEEGLKVLVEEPPNYQAKRKWTKMMDKMPVDPWGAPYHYIVLPNGEFGIYTNGKDGISHSRGNDPDDWNSWSENVEPAEPLAFPFNRSGALALALIAVLSTPWFLRVLKRRASPSGN